MGGNSDKKIIAFTVVTIMFAVLTMSYNFLSSVSMEKKKGTVAVSQVVEKKNVPDVKRVSFVGVGDNLIHDSIYNAADRRKGGFHDGQYDFDHIYENISPHLKKYDLRYINQESIIGGDSFGAKTYPAFNTPSSMISSLTKAGFNVVNMANNHSLDMHSQGIVNSVNLWKKTGIYHTGVFATREDSEKPIIIDKNGIKIAFLAYTYGTNGIQADTPWRVSYLSEDKVKKDIEKVKPISDFILVSTHWGEEGRQDIDSCQRKYSKLFNDLGVDVVLGTHAHRIQKVEWLKNKNNKKTLVYFGTGNFVHNMIPAISYLEGMASFDFVKEGNKKYIANAKFTPLVYHFEYNQYGLDGTVYRLDEYDLEKAKKHPYLRRNPVGNLQAFKNEVYRLVPKDMVDMNEKNIKLN